MYTLPEYDYPLFKWDELIIDELNKKIVIKLNIFFSSDFL